ncbi:protein translocase subunit SecF [Modestobacter sp. VKM Ac-2979]|uniref:protein translocase subunit SecF n=1 Tax=unclassified Modestobacter TaxID=2643866 RepID=UPI0022ABB14D|nr:MULTISPECIES: protein translocase subunit SecF [unclassified Modestobacter]MCZ2812868.1 protein translocase subunit SecF [Modestobacter sp. VKM Ac-2979]MCZ2843103.1 protein translocase subunit SecF [Modestobacter sp. VKM Ac-2980]
MTPRDRAVPDGAVPDGLTPEEAPMPAHTGATAAGVPAQGADEAPAVPADERVAVPADERVDATADERVDATADEEVDDAEVRDEAAGDSTGDQALADAGLPAEGTTPPATPGRPRASLAHRLYNGEAGLDVVGRRRFWFRVTAVVMLLCVAAMVFRGFNFGIEFAGGNSVRVAATSAELGDVRQAAEDAGAQVSSAQVVGGDSVLLRTSALDEETETAVVAAVADAAGVDQSQVSQQSVSADWGGDVTNQALIALAVFLVAVVAFLAVRFRPTMAIAAIVALLHDIVVTAGIYALVGFEVSPSTVIGLLTILGFSLYDTVVVFDKVDENTKDLEKNARSTYGEAANLAVNQTLMRSINTSVIALLPVAGLLFVGAGLLGAGTLKDLALVLFVGLAAGTYSSIFLATPVLAELEERRPEQQALRRRVLARRSAETRQGGALVDAPVATARRGSGATRRSAVALAERDEALPEQPTADVPIESPASVRPGVRGGTTTPRPGQRPTRPGQRPAGRKRR